MATKWSKDNIMNFIVSVQQYPCLYSVKSLAYLDRTEKAQALNDMLRHMQESMPTIRVDDIKNKLRNLRTQYLHELRMVEASKKSGSGMGDIYVPKLWCYDQLQFLKHHVEMRAAKDNIEASNVPPPTSGGSTQAEKDGGTAPLLDSASTSFSEDSTNFETPQRKRAKKSDPFSSVLTKIHNFQDRVLTQRQNKPQKQYDWLGNLVSSEMENIDPEDRADAAWKVQCVMREFSEKARQKRSRSPTSTASSTNTGRDILELSMDGVFEYSDFE